MFDFEMEIENGKKLIHILEVLNNYKEDSYLTAKDISKTFNCSEDAAREYMHRDGFPLIECGKELKVSSLGFKLYNLGYRFYPEEMRAAI